MTLRLGGLVLDNAKAAFGIRKANQPKSWPVMSLPYLLSLDELGITYHAGYPAAQHWYRDDLVMEHGKSVNTKALAKKKAVSTIMGHVHRLEAQSHTVETGRNTVARTTTIAVGTLSRVDGAVPSYGSGTDHSGRPVRNVEDWMQGCAVVTYDPEPGGPISYEFVQIHDGTGVFRGQRFTAGKWFDPIDPL